MHIKSVHKDAWLNIQKESNSEDYFVELRDENLHAKVKVYGYMSDHIIDLFQYMKENWNKKPNPKEFSSLEGEFCLRFSMDNLGHITLAVSLCPNLTNGWKVQANIYIAPNQLESLYNDIKEMFGNTSNA